MKKKKKGIAEIEDPALKRRILAEALGYYPQGLEYEVSIQLRGDQLVSPELGTLGEVADFRHLPIPNNPRRGT